METSIEIGGNKFFLKTGTFLTKIGKNYIDKGTKTLISNPTSKLISPFALIINFTVNTTDKYQLITQGDYKNKYKEFGVEDNPISTDEMFMILKNHQKEWFLKF